jgi:hypothetical protein
MSTTPKTFNTVFGSFKKIKLTEITEKVAKIFIKDSAALPQNFPSVFKFSVFIISPFN